MNNLTYIEEIRQYWNTRAEGYSQKSLDELETAEGAYWSGRLTRHLPQGERLTCMDMGCGPGMLGILLGKMGHHVTFFDYSEEMLAQAEQNAQGLSATFVRGDAQAPDFPDGTFDVIVSRNLVWNLEQPEEAYRQWLRMLKPGGRLIVFDGNHYLHQFQTTYAEIKHCPKYRDPHTKEYMKGVDPEVMARIARHLPLSCEERPAWDASFFLQQPLTSLLVEPHWQKFHGHGGKRKSIIQSFAIVAEK
ncbi:MAG: methyltransferase domain-containing protein [Eubacteriales bacterium]